MRPIILTCLLLIMAPMGAAQPVWVTVAPGLDWGEITVENPSTERQAGITVLRIDPDQWSLEYVGQSNTDAATARTARQWCEDYGLTAAINAGMYAADGRTHVGYLASRGHVDNDRVNQYQSAVAFDPRPGKDVPRFRLFDLDEPRTTVPGILEDYESVAQNLRLIKRPGANRWSQQGKRWSEAALGEDDQGNILFIFSRAPFTMHDFNEALLESGLGVVAAQHLEGGLPAQLHLNAGDHELDLLGSYETGVAAGGGARIAWPIPSVLGIRRR